MLTTFVLLLSPLWAANWNLEIEKAVQNTIQQEIQKMVDGPVDVTIEELGVQQKFSCDHIDTIDIQFPTREDFRGLIRIHASLFEDGIVCQELRFQSRVRIEVVMPVSKNSVLALEEVEVEPAPVRYDQIQGTPIPLDSGPWVARTNLKKREPLTMERVKLKPLNYEGDQVAVSLKKKGLEIQTQGKLMSDAYKNSRVRVFVLATSVVLSGILINKNHVEIVGDEP